MEKIILLVVALIISMLWKKMKKMAEEKELSQTGGSPQQEISPDAIPLPEAWGKLFPMQDLFKPAPTEMPAKKSIKKQESPAKQIKDTSSLAGTLGEHKFSTIAQPTPSFQDDEDMAPENDFTIHSTEEARRAIIWSEILQRKY